MDTHDLARGRGIYEEVVRQIQQPVLVVSVSSDALYVPGDQRSLHSLLPNSHLLEIDSAHGHDGFLIDAETFEPEIRRFVKGLADSRRSLRHADEQRSVAAVRPLKYAW
jgi:homoserine O-acetyltransferase